MCRGSGGGRGVSEAAVAGGFRADGGLSATTVRGIWGDLEDRMIQHPGIRWHRAQIVSTVEDGGPFDFSLPPPP